MARNKKCPQCSETVKSEALICRFCGHQFTAVDKPKASLGKGCLIILGAVIALAFIGSIFAPKQPVGNSAAPAAKSTSDPGYELASKTALAAGLALKSAARNPDSLVIESALASRDGKVLCLAYRAQNGFGGMNRVSAAYEDGAPRTGRKFWAGHCRSDMMDVTSTVKLGAGL